MGIHKSHTIDEQLDMLGVVPEEIDDELFTTDLGDLSLTGPDPYSDSDDFNDSGEPPF